MSPGRPADVAPAPPAEVLGPLGLLGPVALVAGRVAAGLDALGLTSAMAVPSAIVAAVALGAAVLLDRADRGTAAAVAVTVAVACVTLAGVLLRLHGGSEGLVPDLVDRGGTARIEARVATEPRSIALGWQTVLTVDAVDGIPTRERAVAFLDDALALGERVSIEASARPLPDGGFGRWLAQAHAVAVLDVRDLRRAASAGPVSRASELVRERIRRAATRHQDAARGGLLVGFVTGDTRLLPDEDADAMRSTGLSHLTAVSGSNTAVLLGGIAALLTLLRIDARLRWSLLALSVVAFAFLTRLEPSVLRAGTMALLVLAAAVAGVARDARHLLAGAVLLLVLVDPMLTWSLGLLLSAGATLGVLVVAPAITLRLERVMPTPVAALLGITLGAQVAVAPALLASFGTIPWVSVPANLVAVPLAALGSTLAFLGSALALVHVGAASSIFALAGPVAEGVLLVARVGARLPGGPVLPESPVVRSAAVVAVIAIASAVVAGVGARRRAGPRSRPQPRSVP